ncbi:junctional sarcoplasmic reticulum protein 1-like [Sarcophilus harrisii]|uniref:junctional sarcoplasmic reticulum protein 1-like n=1 Tax=Sarcophilus harrisii TaxID=9305 RepID=UPI001301D799|nr:junctional sarcoplasmic reticulum protein 1-like [Sarcophilus harrisii]
MWGCVIGLHGETPPLPKKKSFASERASEPQTLTSLHLRREGGKKAPARRGREAPERAGPLRSPLGRLRPELGVPAAAAGRREPRQPREREQPRGERRLGLLQDFPPRAEKEPSWAEHPPGGSAGGGSRPTARLWHSRRSPHCPRDVRSMRSPVWVSRGLGESVWRPAGSRCLSSGQGRRCPTQGPGKIPGVCGAWDGLGAAQC